MALSSCLRGNSFMKHGQGESFPCGVPIASLGLMRTLQWNPNRICEPAGGRDLHSAFIHRLSSLHADSFQNSELCRRSRATAVSSPASSSTPQYSDHHLGLLGKPTEPAAIALLRQHHTGIHQGTPTDAAGGYVVAKRDVKCQAKISVREGVSLDDVPHLRDYIDDLPKDLKNPLQDNPAYRAVRQYFVEEDDIVVENDVFKLSEASESTYFRRAGPREDVCFHGDEVRAAIVTCGGLCPGLNTVIREIVCGLWATYGVRHILGIKGGYAGFYSSNTIDLNPKVVNDIHKRGGTILGTSRGGHDKTKIVSSILDRGINQVYIIGGDGTHKGANVIYEELRRRKAKVVVAGIPKTVDNDIAVIDKSFGFDTAVEEAQRAINAAHVEAESSRNGIGVVKLMGRYSGYIAMYATLASRDVDCCLIPEVPFYLEGPGGLFEFVRTRLRESKHMILVVAEGAGQELITEAASHESDKSGNAALRDVGLWLCQELRQHFSGKEEITLKYIDPTYMVRAIPSNASDNVYCTLLAHSAMHGAMAGYTGFTVGPVNGRHAYIPISTAVARTNKVSITDRMWARLLTSTGQPDFLQYDKAMEAKSVGNIFTAQTSGRVLTNGGTILQESKAGGVENRPVGKKAT